MSCDTYPTIVFFCAKNFKSSRLIHKQLFSLYFFFTFWNAKNQWQNVKSIDQEWRESMEMLRDEIQAKVIFSEWSWDLIFFPKPGRKQKLNGI